ncbi:MAG: FG-GAP repeat domain-containing protein, partial [Terriglobia bacterium]
MKFRIPRNFQFGNILASQRKFLRKHNAASIFGTKQHWRASVFLSCVGVLSCLAILVSRANSIRATEPTDGDAAAPSSKIGQPVEFVDVASAAGLGNFRLVSGGLRKDYVLESMSGGAAFLDFDNDGWLDIYLINGSTFEELRAGHPGPPSRLYHNRGNGTFEDVTEKSGAGTRGWGMGVCAADVDGDGWVDLYVTRYGSNVLLMNQGDGTFREVDRGIGTGGWSTGCGFADYDRDGDLDLYVARYVTFDITNPPPPPGGNLLCKFRGLNVFCGPRGLDPLCHVLYRQEMDGRFVATTHDAEMDVGAYYGLGVVWADYNNDGWPDLYVANDSMPNLVFLNRHNGTFSEEGMLTGLALSADGRE